jgi:1-acyl-sn-glycerol-3-phosphate acyltransferase
MSPAVRDPVLAKLRSFAGSRSALVLVATWAFAEAVAWPIIPDVLIFPLVLAAPRRWFLISAVALAASLSGGLVAYMCGASSAGSELLHAAPVVTDRMIDVARSTLQERGAFGLLAQPLSGIPYKVFAFQAAPSGLGVVEYLGMSALARGSRFMAAALLGAGSGTLLRRIWERFFSKFLVLYTIGFGIGLARVVYHWR